MILHIRIWGRLLYYKKIQAYKRILLLTIPTSALAYGCRVAVFRIEFNVGTGFVVERIVAGTKNGYLYKIFRPLYKTPILFAYLKTIL